MRTTVWIFNTCQETVKLLESYGIIPVQGKQAYGKGKVYNMIVLCYKKCSTCKKALKWLDEHGIVYEERPIKEENPTKEELTQWYKRSGLALKRFFNTSGSLYKEMQLKDKLPQMTEEEQLALLATDGMLVKRPLVVTPEVILTGFRQAEWEEHL